VNGHHDPSNLSLSSEHVIDNVANESSILLDRQAIVVFIAIYSSEPQPHALRKKVRHS
jgi:hypothetical protein